MARVRDSRPNAARRRRLRELLHNMQAGRCAWCDGVLHSTSSGELDRITPGKEGGTYRFDNLVLACEGCNRSHGHDVRWGRHIERSTA